MTIARRLFRDRRRSTLWWLVGIVGLVGLTVAFFPSIENQSSFDDIADQVPDSMRQLFGMVQGVSLSSAPGYLWSQLFATMLPILLLIFGVGLGARIIAGSEEDGTLELLLANPVTRTRVAGERVVAGVGLLALLGVGFTVALVLIAIPVGALDGVSTTGLLGATAGGVCLALLHTAIAYAVGAAWGRRGPAIAAAVAVAAAGFVLEGLVSASDALSSLRFFTPWHWYLRRNMLVEGVSPEAIVVPLVLSTALFVAGTVAFARRDLR